jgi:alpha/beta superfamily hydrolase
MRPTKDLDRAVTRLQRAADAQGLMAYGGFSYGGSIASDLQTVLLALHQLREGARGELRQAQAGRDE